MEYNITIFGNVDFAYSIMTAVSRLVTNNSKLEYAAAAIFFIFLLFAWVKHIFDPEKAPFPGKHFALGIILFLVFVSTETAPRMTVVLESPYGFDADYPRYMRAPAYRVDDVPAIVAVPAFIVTNLFRGIRDTFATEFQSPNYNGSSTAQSALKSLITLHNHAAGFAAEESDVSGDIEKYIGNCVRPFAQMQPEQGAQLMKQFQEAPLDQAWSKLAISWDVPKTTLAIKGGTEHNCPEAHQFITEHLSDEDYQQEVFASANSKGVYSSDLQLAVDLFTDGPGPRAYDVAVSNFVMYSVGEGLHNSNLGNYATLAIFEGQRRRAYEKTSEANIWMNIMIPAVTAMETFAFYIAPFVVIMSMAGNYGFKMVTGYLTLVVYVNLWGFVQIFTDWYTVATIENVIDFSNKTDVINPANYTDLVGASEGYLSMAGALTASIPLLSTMLLYGGVHSVMGVMRNLTQGGADASRMNPSITSSQNQGAMQMMDMSSSVQSQSGAWTMQRVGGQDADASGLGTTASSSRSLSNTASEMKSQAITTMQQAGSQFQTEFGRQYSHVQGFDSSQARNFQVTDAASAGASLGHTMKGMTTISDQSRQTLAASLGVTAGAGLGKTSGKGWGFDLSAFAAKMGVSIEAAGAYLRSVGLDESKINGALGEVNSNETYSTQFGEVVREAEQISDSLAEKGVDMFSDVRTFNETMQRASALQAMSGVSAQVSANEGLNIPAINAVLGREGSQFYDKAATSLYEAMGDDALKALGITDPSIINGTQGEKEAAISNQMKIMATDNSQGREIATNALAGVMRAVGNFSENSGDLGTVLNGNKALQGVFGAAAEEARAAGGPGQSGNEASGARQLEIFSQQYGAASVPAPITPPATSDKVDLDNPANAEAQKEAVINANKTQEDLTNYDNISDGIVKATNYDSSNTSEMLDKAHERALSAKAELAKRFGLDSGATMEEIHAAMRREVQPGSAIEQVENGKFINVGRLLKNFAGKLTEDGVTVGQALGSALHTAAGESGIPNAAEIARGAALMADSSMHELHMVAQRAAAGDVDANKQMLDFKAAVDFINTDAGREAYATINGSLPADDVRNFDFNRMQADKVFDTYAENSSSNERALGLILENMTAASSPGIPISHVDGGYLAAGLAQDGKLAGRTRNLLEEGRINPELSQRFDDDLKRVERKEHFKAAYDQSDGRTESPRTEKDDRRIVEDYYQGIQHKALDDSIIRDGISEGLSFDGMTGLSSGGYLSSKSADIDLGLRHIMGERGHKEEALVLAGLYENELKDAIDIHQPDNSEQLKDKVTALAAEARKRGYVMPKPEESSTPTQSDKAVAHPQGTEVEPSFLATTEANKETTSPIRTSSSQQLSDIEAQPFINDSATDIPSSVTYGADDLSLIGYVGTEDDKMGYVYQGGDNTRYMIAVGSGRVSELDDSMDNIVIGKG